MFYIVEFLDEVTGDGKPVVDIIPTCWFKNDEQVECYWPVGLNVSISKAATRMVQPDPSTGRHAECLYLAVQVRTFYVFGGGKV